MTAGTPYTSTETRPIPVNTVSNSTYSIASSSHLYSSPYHFTGNLSRTTTSIPDEHIFNLPQLIPTLAPPKEIIDETDAALSTTNTPFEITPTLLAALGVPSSSLSTRLTNDLSGFGRTAGQNYESNSQTRSTLPKRIDSEFENDYRDSNTVINTVFNNAVFGRDNEDHNEYILNRPPLKIFNKQHLGEIG